ncbi:MAG: ribosome maturation factor RimP [SAR324 cluster bacterium]|nr:ribosome maturation factor RimP [SAR324 cluster bacterium]
MAKTEQIVELLEQPIEQAGYELWDIEYKKEGDTWFLRLFIDHPQGIALDDCVKVNRIVSPILEVKDLIPQEYTLEVSSPGIFRSLKTAKHFIQSIGSTVQVNLFQAVSGRKKIVGPLISANTEEFEILSENQERMVLSYQQVSKVQIQS